MESSGVLLFPPYWFLGAAAFVGAALSRMSRRSKKKMPDGRPDSTVKWVLVCVYLTAAVVLATVGFLAPTVRRYLDQAMLIACGAAALIAFAVLRFRRSVGVPVLVLSAAAVVFGALLLRALVAYTGETEIATVRVLSSRDGAMTLELTPTGAKPEVVEMRGDYFSPIVKVVIFNDLYVFLGNTTWYRFEGLTSFRAERDGDRTRFRQETSDYYLPRAPGISEWAYGVLERGERWIPGVKTVQVEMDLKRVEPKVPGGTPGAYSIRVQNDGGVEVVPVG